MAANSAIAVAGRERSQELRVNATQRESLMAIRVRDKGRDFVPAPDGLQRAVCCDVVDLGLVDGKYGQKRMVQLRWQSEHKMEDGKPFLLMRRFGANLHKKGQLRPMLEAWRGKALTETEADDFDLEVLLGKNCQLLVVHESRDGTTYSNIQTIVPAAKGAAPLKVSEDYKRVQDRPDYKPPAAEEPAREPGDEQETEVVVEDDIPF